MPKYRKIMTKQKMKDLNIHTNIVEYSDKVPIAHYEDDQDYTGTYYVLDEDETHYMLDIPGVDHEHCWIPKKATQRPGFIFSLRMFILFYF